MRFFDFQVNYMLYWRFHFKKEIPINRLFTQWRWTYILDFGPWRSAFDMGYMDKRPSFLGKDNMHEGLKDVAVKDMLAPPEPYWPRSEIRFLRISYMKDFNVVVRPSGMEVLDKAAPLQVRRGYLTSAQIKAWFSWKYTSIVGSIIRGLVWSYYGSFLTRFDKL